MDSANQVIFVLQVALTIGPVAVYFLGLGLVSSQAHPCLVSERSDFVLLALAFVPLIVWPFVALLKAGSVLVALALLSAVIILFFTLLPRRNDGWVIYNISTEECRRALARACRRLGWQLEPTPGDDTESVVLPPGLGVSLHGMPWLRNVTIRCELPEGSADEQLRRDLLEGLAGELRRESLLPSPTGAGLVVIGATMLGLPMWYLFRHMDSIVDVVRRIILA
ncbi:MAG TPA: hypothetical protein PL151_06970 [Phycisphaerae bacterium]|nr:hypothetical protein [Phycisphaerae bacterium]HOJ73730.1 hypothetical protein [Phycisphaerae bacterium]HOM50377.1 hypothetical protein [Phycisphaerae bacterium]HON66297.1 hypothetical protein [Phycisphaerae bacterium]HOQ84211.1 hypothetical protein [Phycisphaerae bacterium]